MLRLLCAGSIQRRHFTRDEIRGLIQNRLCVDAPALRKTKLSQWLAEHRDTLGRRYTSELARRTDRVAAYRSN